MLHYYRVALLQDVRSRTTPQKSDSRPASAANSTEWRIARKFLKTDKTAAGTFYVYVVFVACYLPFYCVRFAMKIVGETILLQKLKFFSFTLIFLNSSLNPLIYCWKMRHVRQAVKEILRNIFTCCQWTKLMHPRLRFNKRHQTKFSSWNRTLNSSGTVQ